MHIARLFYAKTVDLPVISARDKALPSRPAPKPGPRPPARDETDSKTHPFRSRCSCFGRIHHAVLQMHDRTAKAEGSREAVLEIRLLGQIHRRLPAVDVLHEADVHRRFKKW